MTGLGGGGKNESEPRLAEMSEAYVFFFKNLYINILTCSHDGSSGRQWLRGNVVSGWTCIHIRGGHGQINVSEPYIVHLPNESL